MWASFVQHVQDISCLHQSRHYTISVRKQAQAWLYIDDEKVDKKDEEEVFQMAQKSGILFAFESCVDSIY